jgi:nucleoside-triphosphatase THEP1
VSINVSSVIILFVKTAEKEKKVVFYVTRVSSHVIIVQIKKQKLFVIYAIKSSVWNVLLMFVYHVIDIFVKT